MTAYPTIGKCFATASILSALASGLQAADNKARIAEVEKLAAACDNGNQYGAYYIDAQPNEAVEKLKKDREGQWSIRINDQWRICFEWPKGAAGPENVEIVDYH